MSYKKCPWTIRDELNWFTKGQQLASLQAGAAMQVAFGDPQARDDLPGMRWGQSTQHCAPVCSQCFPVLCGLSSHYLCLYLFLTFNFAVMHSPAFSHISAYLSTCPAPTCFQQRPNLVSTQDFHLKSTSSLQSLPMHKVLIWVCKRAP